MKDLHRGILILLKSAITGEPGTLPRDFSMEAALPVIRKHDLQLLAYQGAAVCGIPASMPEMKRLLQVYMKHMLFSEGQMAMVQRLYDAFDANGIDYMPLKGCNMKALYPKPELRPMGDADILIRMEQYERIRPVVAGLGMTEGVESDHEYVWKSESLKLELHKRLIPSYNPDYYAYFGDGWRLARRQDGCRWAMSREDGFIYQFVHYAKHYRDGGAGCRHVLDLWVYLRAYPGMDLGYIRRELEKLQLLQFYENITRLLEFWFEDGGGDDRAEYMTAYIFDGGTFGAWQEKAAAMEARSLQNGGTVRGNKLRRVLWSVFLPLENMTVRYPVLKRAPWLLPVMWVVRGVHTVLLRREKLRKTGYVLRHVNQETVDGYQEALDYVGLKFRFDT